MIGNIPALQFAKELYAEIDEDEILDGAAALAFYLMLAIFPAMLFLMAVIPYLPIPHVDQAIMDLLRQAMPANAAELFTNVVEEVTKEQRGGVLSLGFLGVVWATSSGMIAVMQQINRTYDVSEARSFVRARLTAIGLSVLFLVLVIGACSLVVMGGVIQEWLRQRLGTTGVLLGVFVVFRWVIVLFALLLGFALIYYIAPAVRQRFVYITPGSVMGVVMLSVASLGFAWYAQSFGDYAATYGSVGAVIVLMLWLYIAGLSILVGSEINALVEHHSPGGKDKGERYEGQKHDDPKVAERVRQAEPSATTNDGEAPAFASEQADSTKGAAMQNPMSSIGGRLKAAKRADDARPNVPGEHVAAFGAGAALLGWARRSRSPVLRTIGWVGGAVLLYRSISGRQGLLARFGQQR